MDHSRFLKLKAGVFFIALMGLSACSSSQVDDADAPPPETVGDTASLDPTLDAKTDVVPQAAPDALDAAPAPISDAPMANNTAAAESLDAPAAISDAPVADAQPIADAADQVAPVSDPVMDAPVADAPVADAPTAVASDTTSDSATVADNATDGVQYKVKRGDTLMKIAFENYGDLYRWKEIYEANRAQISDPSHVPPGTVITLNGAGMVTIERNGEQYLIKHGDTLGLISDSVYGTTKKWKKLWENNRQLIKDPNKIYAGFYLYYQPEARLTHDQDAAPSTEGGSAANTVVTTPVVNAVAVKTSAPAVTAPVPVAPVAAQQAMPAVRTPASK